MWDHLYARRALGLDLPFDMLNSPFAFPRIPPRANPPLGISNAGKIKDAIIRDKDLSMNQLDHHQAVFQRYAVGLFNLSPNQFSPGHPMAGRVNAVEELREENEKLRRENSLLKTGKKGEKKN